MTPTHTRAALFSNLLVATAGDNCDDRPARPNLDSLGNIPNAFYAFREAFRPTGDLRLARFGAGTAKSAPRAQARPLPAYLVENYWWAYLRPASLKIFDHTAVVSAILWGCYRRLKRAAFVELKAGQKVLQAACVYGKFSPHLANLLGPEGALDIIDIAPIQVENCRGKLRRFPNTQVRIADAAAPGGGPYDIVCCFFLLHELPDEKKRNVVDALLNSATPAGKVVFIDYHRPVSRHPLKALMGLVFDQLEPFAKTLWRCEISSFASSAEKYTWRKETYFGDLYQKVVAEKPVISDMREPHATENPITRNPLNSTKLKTRKLR